MEPTESILMSFPQHIISKSESPAKIPKSTYQRIIFAYDHKDKAYKISDSLVSLKLISSLCRRNQIPVSLIINLIDSVNSAVNKDSANIGLKTPLQTHSYSMKLLYTSTICLITFLALAVLQTYYFRTLNLIDIGLPIACIGLGICCFLIITRGNYKLKFPSLCINKSLFLDVDHRHAVFEVINKFNIQFKHIFIKLGEKGYWIEIEEEY